MSLTQRLRDLWVDKEEQRQAYTDMDRQSQTYGHRSRQNRTEARSDKQRQRQTLRTTDTAVDNKPTLADVTRD